jgi:hypothetical protein
LLRADGLVRGLLDGVTAGVAKADAGSQLGVAFAAKLDERRAAVFAEAGRLTVFMAAFGAEHRTASDMRGRMAR